jgi:ABC-type amino acid transport system permease subunit
VCGGFQGVAQGQVEAARAVGLPMWLTIWHVVLPQAIHKVIPPLTNAAIVMMKNTSLVPIGGIFDVLSGGRRRFAGRGAFATANPRRCAVIAWGWFSACSCRRMRS